MHTLAFVDGIWVCSLSCVVGLATALRSGLIEVAKNKLAVEGGHEKMELVYNYLASPELQHRVTGIVEAFVQMHADLSLERRAMQRIWAKREKQIERAVASTAGLYGDLQGIIGASLPELVGLAMPRLNSSELDADQIPSTSRQCAPALVGSGPGLH